MSHPPPPARIPSATYRLQFNGRFTFRDAVAVLPYLHDLGISDIYSSSWLAAREGSLHGYDIVDPSRVNPEIGSREELDSLTDALAGMGMGQILDFVPNHMCIESTMNEWWMDMLENGPCSPHARFFDINWHPVKQELTNRVLLPFLGAQYGQVLERGELTLSFENGAFFIGYYDKRFPVEPGTTLQILNHRMEALDGEVGADDPGRMEFLSILTAIQHLPPTTESDPQKIEERYREKEVVKQRLARLCSEHPFFRGFIEENVRMFNGTKGDPKSFDLLDRLLCAQVYRLSFWRVATEEINYRRFFDINGLGAIRTEDPVVFRETHSLLLDLIRQGKVTGVRVDHVDGLYDPLAYLRRLQQACWIAGGGGTAEPGGTAGEAAQVPFRPFYIVCEKILLKGERLPEEWPVYGTTGYDFLNSLNGIFVEADNGKAFDSIYSRFTSSRLSFPEVMYEKKLLVMLVSLSSEVNTLAHYLNMMSEHDRLTRDFTLNSLNRALREVIAFFPVYRTYISREGVREKDAQYIDAAVSKARRKNPAVSGQIYDFVRAVLLLKAPPYLGEPEREEWLSFVMRFQQITGPVTAKGVEDTAFYVYNRLLSLNEVGGMPDRFGNPLEAFHGHNLERYKNFPHSMLATATHDTKRGEDLRARLNVLSEMPERWQRKVRGWSRLNRNRRMQLDGQYVPDRNEEYLIYQTLLGAWPPYHLPLPELESFRNRIKEFMVKAVREAKVNSSWVNPNPAYEEALLKFLDGLVQEENGFMADFRPFQQEISRFGMLNSISQLLLKVVSPGVPDFYQGTELWDFSLVDPDNRRPVDYSVRQQGLALLKRLEREQGKAPLARQLLVERETGLIKQFVIWKALSFRSANGDLFRFGDYRPLETAGSRARNVCAFSRKWGDRLLVAVVSRFFTRLLPDPDGLPIGEQVWQDTVVNLVPADSGSFRDVLTGETLHEPPGRATSLPVALALRHLPVALLERVEERQGSAS